MGMYTATTQTLADMSNGKNPIEGGKRKANDLAIQFALSEKGNPKNYQLSPDQIKELRQIPNLDEKLIDAPVQTYICKDVNACHPMPSQDFSNLKKALTTGDKYLLP